MLSVTVFGIFAVHGGVLAAQTRPDFAGRWTVEPDSIGDLGSGWGPSITITQDVNRLVVEYAFFEQREMQPPLSFVYALDGSETTASIMMGRGIQTQTSSALWDGASLVIRTRHPFENPVTDEPMTSVVRRTISLESPTSLIVVTERQGVLGGSSSTTRTVYRKVQSPS
jgi:hypothetical protein